MEKSVIRTEAAPAPFQGAPYNQAIVVGELVFVAGQLGLEPGDTAVAGNIGEQTEQALANLAAILEAAGSSMDRVVNVTFILSRPEDFPGMNEEWTRWFPDNPPARSGARHPLQVENLLISMAVIAEA